MSPASPGRGPEGAEDANADGIYASPDGGSSVLVSDSRDGTGLRALEGNEKLYSFPYGVVYNPEAQKLEIRRDGMAVTEDTLQIPASGSPPVTYTYTAALLDQMGMAMKESVSWSTTEWLPDGVTRSAETVTVSADAVPGSFTLTAECGGKKASVVITVSNKADAGGDHHRRAPDHHLRGQRLYPQRYCAGSGGQRHLDLDEQR